VINKKIQDAFLLALITMLLSAFFNFSSLVTATNDSYWHIAMGERFVEEPFFSKDTFSFTYQGQEITSYPYMFEVGLYYLDKLWGYEAASHIFLYAVYVLGLIFTALYAYKTKKSFIVLLVAIAGFSYFYSQRMLVRPDLLYFPFIAIALYLYRMAANDFTLKSYLWLLLMALVWSNYYTAIFLYVIFAGLYLDLAIKYWKEQKNKQQWALLTLSGVVLLTSEFITPFGQHSLLAQMHFDPRWKTHIIEYWSIFDGYLKTYHIFPFLMLVLLAVGLAVKTRAIGYLLIVLVFVIASIQMSRVIPFAGFVMVLLVIDMIRVYSKQSDRTLILFSCTALLAVIFLVLIGSKVVSKENDAAIIGRHHKPSGLINYYKEQGYSGNIFNDYNLGGYLIYHLAPESKVYIDGRTHILYDFDFFDHHRKVLSNETYIREIDDKYGLDYLIIRNNPDFYLTAYHTGKFALDFLDENFALFKKGKANFRMTGLIAAAPYCWQDIYAEKIQNELRNRKIEGLNENLVNFLGLLQNYIKAENKNIFLNNNVVSVGDFSKRFIGYQLLFEKEYQKTIDIFLSVQELKLRDYLAIGISAAELGNYTLALQATKAVTNNSSMRFDDVDVILLKLLISRLSDEVSLSDEVIIFYKAIQMDIRNRDMASYLSMELQDLVCNPNLSLTGKIVAEKW